MLKQKLNKDDVVVFRTVGSDEMLMIKLLKILNFNY